MEAKCWVEVVAVALLVSACSSPSGGKPSELPAGGAAGNGGASGASGGGGSGGGGASGTAGGLGEGFRVAIEAERTTLCPGQCVELSANAIDGREPYRYEWSNELGDHAGPYEVCPDSTTTYSVEVTDTGVQGEEFGRESDAASASIEIRVDDGCEPADGGVTEPQGTTELCSARIPYTTNNWISAYVGWEGNSNVAIDGDGNVYFSGAFSGTFAIGDLTMTSVGIHDGFVVKYDPSCRPLWVKTFGAPEAQIGFGAIAIAPNGEIAVGGSIAGTADFGRGLLSSGLNSAALLLKIQGDDGSLIWSQAFASLLLSGAIWDVGIDDSGDIVISGHSSADVSFGGPALGGAAGGNIAFLAKLSASGEHRFSFSATDSDLAVPFALHRSGVIALTGWTNGTGVTINGHTIPLPDSTWKRYVAMLDGAGEVLWGHELEEPEEWNGDDALGYWGTGIALDADRNVIVEHADHRETEAGGIRELPERITKLDPNGAVLWSKQIDDSSTDIVFYGEGGVAVDTHGNIAHTDESDEPGTVTPEALDAGIAPQNRLYVRKLTPNGEIVWRHEFHGASRHWAWGITTAPDDSVWLAHGEEGGEPSSGIGALVITKLAP